MADRNPHSLVTVQNLGEVGQTARTRGKVQKIWERSGPALMLGAWLTLVTRPHMVYRALFRTSTRREICPQTWTFEPRLSSKVALLTETLMTSC